MNSLVTKDPHLEEIVKNGLLDTGYFAKVFMPEAFYYPKTEYDTRLWKLIDDMAQPKTCICGYRSLGKSTRLEAYAIKNICYRQALYIMYVGHSLPYAEERTESIKAELLENDSIRTTFGIAAPKYMEGQQKSFSKKSWYVSDPTTGKVICYIVPKSAYQTTRGFIINIGGKRIRPDLIICDDMEDDEAVLNPESRIKLWKWFQGALCKCVPQEQPNPQTDRWDIGLAEKPPWRIFYMDTLKHPDANIQHVMGSPEWRSVVMPQGEYIEETKGYRSFVPEIVSDEQLAREAEIARQGDYYDVFCREKLCLPTSPEDRQFARSMFRYYSDDGTLNTEPLVAKFIVVDPASTANPTSCYSSFKAVAVNSLDNKIIVRKHEMKRLHIDDLANAVLDMSLQFNTRLIFIEKTGMQDALKSVFHTAASKRELGVQFEWLEGNETPKGDYGGGKEGIKRARALMIHPFMKQGHVFFDESMKNGLLERELLNFPHCINWDGTDTLGYIPTIMAKLNIYFAPRPLAEGETRPNYKKLMYDDAVEAMMRQRTWAGI